MAHPCLAGVAQSLPVGRWQGIDGSRRSLHPWRGLRDKVKVIIGGAPISQKFAEQIGADGYSNDAAQAVKLVRSLL